MKNVKRCIWRRYFSFFMVFSLILGTIQSSLLLVMAGNESGIITNTELRKENGTEIMSGETIEAAALFRVYYDFYAKSDEITEGSLEFEVPEGVEIVQVQNQSVQGVSGGAIELQNIEGEKEEGTIHTKAVLKLVIPEDFMVLDLAVTGKIELLCRWTETAPTGISMYKFGNKTYQICLSETPEFLETMPSERLPEGVLTNVEMFKGTSSVSGEKIIDGMEIRLKDGLALKYSMPSLEKVQTNVKYELPSLPEELKISSSGTIPLQMNYQPEGNPKSYFIKFGEVYAEAGKGNLSIQFIEPAFVNGGDIILPELQQVKNAWFELGVGLEKENLPTDTGGKIKIDLPCDNSINLVIQELKPKEASLTKEASQLKPDHTIDWTLTYTPPSQAVEEAKTPNEIVDVLPEELEYVENSFAVTVSGSSISSSNVTVSGQSIVYRLPDPSNGETITITYTTRLTDHTVKKIWSNGSFGEVKNSAEAKRDGKSISPKVQATAAVSLNNEKKNLQLLSKDGKFSIASDGSKKIDWVVKVKTVSRNFKYLTLIDTMGKALEAPDEITVQADNQSTIYRKQKDNSGFTVEKNSDGTTTMKLPLKKEEVSNKAAGIYIITYSTIIAEEYFMPDENNQYQDNDVKNKATLDFEWLSYDGIEPIELTPPEIGKGPVDTGVDRHIVLKETVNKYNASEHTMEWKITVNPKQVDITEATLTDILPKDLEYVTTATEIRSSIESEISNVITEITLGKIIEEGENKGKDKLEIKFGALGKKSFSFTVKTKVTNPELYKNNKTVKFINTVGLNAKVKAGTNGQETEVKDRHSATQEMKSQVLAKKTKSYDPKTKMVQWQIDVNQNKDPNFGSVTITETLPKGLTYSQEHAEAKLTTEKGAVVSGSSISSITVDSTDVDDKQKVVFKIDNVTEHLVLTFWTAVDINDEPFRQNTAVTFGNHIEMETKEAVKVNVNADFKLDNQILSKVAKQKNNNEYQYTVKLNPLGSNLNKELTGIFLKDTLQDGLYLDVESVALYETRQTAKILNGKWTVNLEKGSKVESQKLEVAYNSVNNAFTVRIPNAEKSYILEYLVYAVKQKVNLINQIELEGTKELANNAGISKNEAKITYEAGSGATFGLPKDKFYTFRMKVFEKDNESKVLEGVQFGLYSAKGEDDLLCTATSGKDGFVVIALPKSIGSSFSNFYWKEISLPTGYIADTTWKEISKEKLEGQDVEAIKVEKVKTNNAGTLKILKVDSKDNTKKLIGAEFALYQSEEDAQKGENQIGTSQITDVNGSCTFNNLEPKTYWIKEMKAPTGYYELTDVVKVDMKERSANIKEVEIIVENEKEIGTLKIIKMDSKDNTKKLAGAKFALYQSEEDAQKGENQIGTSQITDVNGSCTFDNLEPKTYWIKEMKAPEGYRILVSSQKVTVKNHAENGVTLKEIKNDIEENEDTSGGGSDTSGGGSDTSGGGSDTSGGGSDTNGGGSDTSGGGSDTSGGGSDTSGGGSDTSGGGSDTSGGGSDTNGGGSDTSGGGSDTNKGESNTSEDHSKIDNGKLPEPEKPILPDKSEKPSKTESDKDSKKKETKKNDKTDSKKENGGKTESMTPTKNVENQYKNGNQNQNYQTGNQNGQGEQTQNQQANTETLPQAGGFMDKKILVILGVLFLMIGLLYEKWERRKRFKKGH